MLEAFGDIRKITIKNFINFIMFLYGLIIFSLNNVITVISFIYEKKFYCLPKTLVFLTIRLSK